MLDLDTHAPLARRERPAASADSPDGLLVLLHGRGADRDDLAPLFDVLDPQQRLHAVTLEAPFTPSGHVGHHWYIVERVGFPDRQTFDASYALLCRDIDALLAELGLSHDRLVLGGFSQGSVMATSVAVGPLRPRIGALFANSGFVPTVDGWNVDAAAAAQLPVLMTHGTLDNVINVGFGSAARERLVGAGAQVEFRQPPIGHELDPTTLIRARELLTTLVPPVARVS
jgi:phospholipase/carboxylesterase